VQLGIIAYESFCLWDLQERTCQDTRAAAGRLLGAICRGGGAALWRDGGFFWEEGLRVAAGALEAAGEITQVGSTTTQGYALLANINMAAQLGGVSQESHRLNPGSDLQN
jgi:hypothetical protein